MSSPGFAVDVRSGGSVIDGLGTCLDDLHLATATPVTARRPWLAAWAEVYAGPELLAVVVRQGGAGRLAAAALLCCREGPHGVELATLGHGRNDRSRLPARDAGAAAALARGIVDLVTSMPSPWRLRLEQLPARDPVAAGIVDLLPTAHSIRAAPVPKVTFGAGDAIDAYLGKGLRKQLRRCRQRLDAEGVSTELAFVTEPLSIEAVIDDVERTHRDRDHSVGRASDIDAREAREFWRRVILDHARRGEVEIAVLRADGELAAYVVSLLDGASYRVLDGRLSPKWSRFSPGRLVETATVERALVEERFSELDWMNSVASEKLVAANAFEEVEHLVACSTDLLRLPDERAALLVLGEDVEGRPTADRALAALAGGPPPGTGRRATYARRMTDTAHRGGAAAAWAEALESWAIPPEVLAAAPEDPWPMPTSVFAWTPERAASDEGADSTARTWALGALPAGGSVLDVGVGGGRASLPLSPPAGSVTGVDASQELLASFVAAAEREGVDHRAVQGRWPEVAGSVEPADVVVSHHVLYDVADLAPFVAALTDHARHAVVVEITANHPLSGLSPLWRALHGIERPTRPTAADALAVLHEMGLVFEHQEEERSMPGISPDRAERVALARRRLCVGLDRNAEIDALLGPDLEPRVRRVVAVRWKGRSG